MQEQPAAQPAAQPERCAYHNDTIPIWVQTPGQKLSREERKAAEVAAFRDARDHGAQHKSLPLRTFNVLGAADMYMILRSVAAGFNWTVEKLWLRCPGWLQKQKKFRRALAEMHAIGVIVKKRQRDADGNYYGWRWYINFNAGLADWAREQEALGNILNKHPHVKNERVHNRPVFIVGCGNSTIQEEESPHPLLAQRAFSDLSGNEAGSGSYPSPRRAAPTPKKPKPVSRPSDSRQPAPGCQDTPASASEPVPPSAQPGGTSEQPQSEGSEATPHTTNNIPVPDATTDMTEEQLQSLEVFDRYVDDYDDRVQVAGQTPATRLRLHERLPWLMTSTQAMLFELLVGQPGDWEGEDNRTGKSLFYHCRSNISIGKLARLIWIKSESPNSLNYFNYGVPHKHRGWLEAIKGDRVDFNSLLRDNPTDIQDMEAAMKQSTIPVAPVRAEAPLDPLLLNSWLRGCGTSHIGVQTMLMGCLTAASKVGAAMEGMGMAGSTDEIMHRLAVSMGKIWTPAHTQRLACAVLWMKQDDLSRLQECFDIIPGHIDVRQHRVRELVARSAEIPPSERGEWLAVHGASVEKLDCTLWDKKKCGNAK